MGGPWEDSHQESHDPRGVQRGKSGSLGVRGKRVRGEGWGWGEGWVSEPQLPLGQSGQNLGELGASMTGLVWFSEHHQNTVCACDGGGALRARGPLREVA